MEKQLPDCGTTIVCKTAEEFISALRPENEFWRGSERGRWAFRGQGNHEFDLVPKAFREDNDWFGCEGEHKGPYPNREEQIAAELRVLHRFFSVADEVGLFIPGDCLQFRTHKDFENYRGFFGAPQNPIWLPGRGEYPPDELLELMALAQHHGIPTRLLDFTFDPLVAAFFAAHSAVSIEKRTGGIRFEYPNTNLAVWGVDLSFIEKSNPVALESYRFQVRKITVSRFHNPFLHQQSGLFLYDALDVDDSKKREFGHALNKMIAAVAQTKPGIWTSNHPLQALFKIEVPCTEAMNVLRLLEKNQITMARLMPTYDNVSKTLRMLSILR